MASDGNTTSIEQGVRKRARRGSIEQAVLGTLAIGGMLTIAMMAPKVLSLLKDEHLDYFVPRNPKQRIQETMSRLKRKDWVRFEEVRGKRYPRLTPAGRNAIERITLGNLSIRRPIRWDRRWRIVIFDIKETRRNDRVRIRLLLMRLGFLRLQDSVWVYPYDCEEVIGLIKTDLRIGRDILYIIADAIEYDRPLREHFDLPVT